MALGKVTFDNIYAKPDTKIGSAFVSTETPQEIVGVYVAKTAKAMMVETDFFSGVKMQRWIPFSQIVASDPPVEELEAAGKVTVLVSAWIYRKLVNEARVERDKAKAAEYAMQQQDKALSALNMIQQQAEMDRLRRAAALAAKYEAEKRRVDEIIEEDNKARRPTLINKPEPYRPFKVPKRQPKPSPPAIDITARPKRKFRIED